MFFDAAAEIIYIGITDDFRRRFSDHRRNSRWWPRAVRWQLVRVNDRDILERVESAAIFALQPPANTVGTRRPWERRDRRAHAGAVRYLDVTEIGEALQMTRQSAAELIARPAENFPLHDAEIGRRPVRCWLPETVRAWATRTGRTFVEPS